MRYLAVLDESDERSERACDVPCTSCRMMQEDRKVRGNPLEGKDKDDGKTELGIR